MYKNRKELYTQLESLRESKVLVYITGDRRSLEAKIASDVIDHFVHHLDLLGDPNKITLVLYTTGGDTSAAWTLVNLIRNFCYELEVVIPRKAHSAGTLICLGANKIVMTKQATLGPIDPSVNTPLNPLIEGGPPNARFPVSVEAINGFVEFCKEHMGENTDLSKILLRLTDSVHPIVLGQVYRVRSQIRMLASKLLAKQVMDEKAVEHILQFLCSDSGSHDYTINRKEASDLGLTIEKPDEALYNIIKGLYDSIASELKLAHPVEPNIELSGNQQVNYSYTRALIESVHGGSHSYVTRGQYIRSQIQVKPGITQPGIQDLKTLEGWIHAS